jgi:hypothetical protein
MTTPNLGNLGNWAAKAVAERMEKAGSNPEELEKLKKRANSLSRFDETRNNKTKKKVSFANNKTKRNNNKVNSEKVVELDEDNIRPLGSPGLYGMLVLGLFGFASYLQFFAFKDLQTFKDFQTFKDLQTFKDKK